MVSRSPANFRRNLDCCGRGFLLFSCTYLALHTVDVATSSRSLFFLPKLISQQQQKQALSDSRLVIGSVVSIFRRQEKSLTEIDQIKSP